MKEKYYTYDDYARYSFDMRNQGLDPNWILENMMGFSKEELMRFSNEGRWGELDHEDRKPRTVEVTGASGPTAPLKAQPNWNYLLIG